MTIEEKAELFCDTPISDLAELIEKIGDCFMANKTEAELDQIGVILNESGFDPSDWCKIRRPKPD